MKEKHELTITLPAGGGTLTVFGEMAKHLVELIRVEEKYHALVSDIQELADKCDGETP